MKRRSVLIIAALVITLPTLVLMGQTFASQRDNCLGHGGFRNHPASMTGMPFGRRMKHMFRMMESLELSQAQRERVWSIQDDKHLQMRTHMASLFEGRKQLQETAINGYDETTVRKLADAQGKTMADLIVLRTQTRSRVRSVLTPEQQAKFSELRTSRRGKYLKN
ncbi:MAG: Spy/CpxP family protein refolding chaperone [Candidatus Thiodiazotropha sp. (ex Lucinoma borealis)]|nr:Spy/CpxP family protein refolding chaperone [Candidatus Thiodiazotropha sp. (ex Lucinoma borealis)]